MLKGEKIVCVGFPKWEGDYMKSTVQLMAELARHNQVLYVDYPFTLKDVAGGFYPFRETPALQILGLRPRLEERALAGGASIHLLRLPPFIPSNWLAGEGAYDHLIRWNARLALPFIRRAMRRLGLSRPIVVNAFNPALGNALAGRLDEKLLVYYCYDEISAARWIGKHGARHEAEFLRRADLTIVSSAALLVAKAAGANRCGLVRNGAPSVFFQQPGPRPQDLPPGSAGTIIGYLGSVDERLDYSLLEYTAAALPRHQFVFVGRIVDQAGARRLERLPNVFLLGPRPPARLPAYVSAFAAGMIPFLKNRLTAGIYPLKANEYLALGKAVVATRFGDMRDLEEVVEVADTREGFRMALEKALSSDTVGRQHVRRAFASANSWEKRAAQFGGLLAGALSGGGSPPEAPAEGLLPGVKTASP